ncbi:conserved hypothetical protein [Nitrobacter hamburgensis X14]|uniref:Uncharacterized protein n=1 Tax=Nitrobacter hamburgensis (strain DSM 10229 / NCIMB 13809 / X14) TaxID=323097 RepID=Q1QLR1_NITHX|nr:hypothetical protein [Nitrobacter hamburgensis]ABE62836.1 conserved hypothetical protein [Nitrobacter hamburgensis X14]
MSEGDPTDDALATIAGLVDKPETSEERDDAGQAPEAEATDQPGVCLAEEIPTTTPVAPNPASDSPSDCAETDSYTKYGPGPLAAVRFKWTTRRGDNGDYFVDETIGDSSLPLVSGPMTKEAAIQFVDDRERDACQRFETLRSEMAGGEIGPREDE